ncbi:hypothetical protein B0H17DRAFT_1065296 [Mycena rosella]|uniref:Uncharacterized protein n=1 Tax=Mycena rosella TaxID=1033263 RepID=A0AAD7DG84_MYCRO|nr:hypothetical protein B0H17DRAFT_1065296 [Mycena rosella]
MPCLRKLKLRSIHVPWRSLRNLEVLSLTGSLQFRSLGVPSFPDLFTMLRACPQLRDSALDLSLPSLSPDFYPDAVELPSLAHIYLRAPVANCAALLNHLTFPATATVMLYPGGLDTGADATGILIPVRKHVRAPFAPPSVIVRLPCHHGLDGIRFVPFKMSISPAQSHPTS